MLNVVCVCAAHLGAVACTVPIGEWRYIYADALSTDTDLNSPVEYSMTDFDAADAINVTFE